MKVLYITTVPSPYKVDMFEELGKMCDLTVIFEKHDVSYRENSWMITKYKNFKAEFLKGIRIKNEILSTGIIKNIKNNNYDVIVIGVYSTISQMIAQLYMKKNNIKYIISSDGGMIKTERDINYKVKKYFISSANAWLSTGKVTTKYLEHYGAKKDRIYIYPFSSVHNNEILNNPLLENEKKEIRTKLGMIEEKIVLSVGQFIYRKGYDILIKATSKLDKSIGIYIVGGNPTKEYLELKKRLKLDNIHFIDFKNKDELSDYYKAADLFVLPTREDIWGLVINEALSHGLPVITTNKCVAGLEMINDKDVGSIIPVDDFEKLAKEINRVFSSKNSKKAIQIAQKYTIENMAKKTYMSFEKILGE